MHAWSYALRQTFHKGGCFNDLLWYGTTEYNASFLYIYTYMYLYIISQHFSDADVDDNWQFLD